MPLIIITLTLTLIVIFMQTCMNYHNILINFTCEHFSFSKLNVIEPINKVVKQTEFLLVMLYSGILLLIGSTYNVAFIDFFFIYAEI